MARGESLEPHPFRARSLRACDPSPLPALLSGEHRPSSTPLPNAPMVRNTPAQRAAKGWVASSHPAPPQPPPPCRIATAQPLTLLISSPQGASPRRAQGAPTLCALCTKVLLSARTPCPSRPSAAAMVDAALCEPADAAPASLGAATAAEPEPELSEQAQQSAPNPNPPSTTTPPSHHHPNPNPSPNPSPNHHTHPTPRQAGANVPQPHDENATVTVLHEPEQAQQS